MHLRLKIARIFFILVLFPFLSQFINPEINMPGLLLIDTLILGCCVLIILLAPGLLKLYFLFSVIIATCLFVLVRLILTVNGYYDFLNVLSGSLIELLVLIVALKFTYDVSKELYLLQSGERLLAIVANFPSDLESEAGEKLIKQEMVRCRRYEHPLSIILIELNSLTKNIQKSEYPKHIPGDMFYAYQKFQISQLIQRQLKITDSLFVSRQDNCFVIICPEINEIETLEYSGKIEQAVFADFGIKLLCATATFPTDGLTFNKIFEEAKTQLNRTVEGNLTDGPPSRLPVFSE